MAGEFQFAKHMEMLRKEMLAALKEWMEEATAPVKAAVMKTLAEVRERVAFVKRIITKNAYILLRSTKRIKTNVDFFTEALKPSNSELIKLLQGHGAEVLDLSSDYMKRNFKNISEQLQLLGCTAEEVKKFFLDYPPAFYASFEKLSNKINCLLESDINIKQLLKKPRILEFSANNLKNRIEELERIGYDFKKHGVTILDSSRRRFEAKLEKLNEEG
ncbi:transcription termination factor 1, mitochondrial-like [Scyliorhinus canicula]|uniref:transcription termination factor 1, mitochondrial-like n=1 Tax=Scyliorhinus canicula TaxID=7830 RepID=UPI0018F6B28F|nr:transcription termination factor 1, mitochondrial-like [Scyliorhinus canicula]